MAKLKNAIKSNQISNKAKELQQKMKQQVEDCEYVDAMDTMAELVPLKAINEEIMYLGAYCYMMTDDNERAVKWINNVLSIDPSNIKARILLARICTMEDRTEDALTIYDFILENAQDKLSEEDRQELDDLLDYYRYAEIDIINEDYPSIARFLGLAEEVKEEPQDEAAERARSAVARLRELLNNKKQAEAEAEACQTMPAEEVQTCIEDTEVEEAEEAAFDVETISQQIMNSPVSMKEKIKLFNTFAAGCYTNGDYQSAFDLLSGALVLDSSDPFVLKNIAYVCAAAGEVEQAMEFVSKLPMVDFGTLSALKK